MTFVARERSVAAAQPVRLYEFARGALRWRYCSADRSVIWQGATWQAVAISDDGVRLTGETSADALTITGPAALPVAQLYRGVPPAAEVFVTVRDLHFGEADLPTSARVVWPGSIATVRWPQADRCEITCEGLGASMDRTGLLLTWDRACPHTVFDQRCGADRAAYAVPGTLVDVDGAAVGAAPFAAHADGYFAGGWIEWPVGGGELDRRGIEEHTGTSLVLMGGTHGLAVGSPVVAYPGCRQTRAYCHDVFGNLDNYGGYAHLPGKSPFDGDPVF